MVARSIGLLTAALVVVIVAVGCGGSGTQATGNDKGKGKTDDKGAGHVHPEKGPHGGPFEDVDGLGGHVEVVVDRDKKTVIVYFVDDDVKDALPVVVEGDLIAKLMHVDPSVEVKLKSEPEKSETGGKSSKFVGMHDALASKAKFQIKISGKIDGKVSSAVVKEK